MNIVFDGCFVHINIDKEPVKGLPPREEKLPQEKILVRKYDVFIWTHA